MKAREETRGPFSLTARRHLGRAATSAVRNRFGVVARCDPLLLLLAAAFVAGGANATELDTAKLAQVRSAVAEAATVLRSQARGQVTETFAEGLRSDIRKDLQKLVADPEVGTMASAALVAVDARDEPALLSLRDRLVALERAHGRSR